DFVDLKKAVNELVLSKLDHAYINDILPQPTAEYISVWIFRQLDAALSRDNCRLYSVRLWETESSSVICRREDAADA
ncbi:MAG: 6-carboxytetrahydropterin synthase, partial [Cloacibacillus sp.]